MPGHPRKLIRNAVVAQLLGETVAGARVSSTRAVPFRRSDLPAVAVYTPTEDVDVETDSAPRELKRTTSLVVEGAVEAGTNPDDAGDDLAWEIETALHADPTFGDTASDAILASTELDVYEEGGKYIAAVKLTFAVTYYVYATPEATADSFTTADVRHNPGGAVHPDNQAHDVVTLEGG